MDFNCKEDIFLLGHSENHVIMLKELISKLFSGQCRLKSLQLDLSSIYVNGGIDECLKSISNVSSNSIPCDADYYCLTLRRLNIRLRKGNFLENLLDHIPNVEQISVEFTYSFGACASPKLDHDPLKPSDGNWSKKVRKKKKTTKTTRRLRKLSYIFHSLQN